MDRVNNSINTTLKIMASVFKVFIVEIGDLVAKVRKIVPEKIDALYEACFRNNLPTERPFPSNCKILNSCMTSSIFRNSLRLKARNTERGASYFTIGDFEKACVSNLME